MHVALVIVIILGMVMDVNAALRVHAEYMRRQWLHGQSAEIKTHNEPPYGVHAEYIRRIQRIQGQPAEVKIPHHALPAREHRGQSTSSVRQHLRHQQRSRYNI